MEWRVTVLLGWIVAGAAACSSEATNYGPPSGLLGKKLPNESAGGPSVTPLDAASTSLQDAGRSLADPAASDSGFRDSAPACAVSWATQIFPNMASGGKWKCSDNGCHGGLQSPRMTADPTATYNTLVGYRMVIAPQKIPYIWPGNADPSKSGIECNLSGGTCGNQMPTTTSGAQLLTAEEIGIIDTWVRCGSPDN